MLVYARKKINQEELINIGNILREKYAWEVYLVLFLILCSSQIVVELMRGAALPQTKGNEMEWGSDEGACILDLEELEKSVISPSDLSNLTMKSNDNKKMLQQLCCSK